MHVHVNRLISLIILECRSIKTDSDKAVQSESFLFITRVPFSKRKSLATISIDIQRHIVTYYFHSYGKFISTMSDLRFCFEFSIVHCMDKQYSLANKVSSQTAHSDILVSLVKLYYLI